MESETESESEKSEADTESDLCMDPAQGDLDQQGHLYIFGTPWQAGPHALPSFLQP